MPNANTITFRSAEGEARGYFARPGPQVPGIVVIQEWWGLVPHIEDVTRRFADHGYISLAPDLFNGTRTTDAKEAERLMNSLDWGEAAATIAAAVGYLRKQGATRVGLVGFCMGGALTVVGAAMTRTDAYVSFYGFPSRPAADLDNVHTPGLFFFGENEDVFSVPDAKAFVTKQSTRGYPTELVMYPDAGHAFFNDTRPEAYRAVPANDAWRRTLAFFGRMLRE